MQGGKPPKMLSSSAWRLATLGTELAGAVIGGSLLGYWIDWHFGTGPWGLVICSSIGIVGGLYNMVRKAVRESLEMMGGPRRHRARPGGADVADEQSSRARDEAGGGPSETGGS